MNNFIKWFNAVCDSAKEYFDRFVLKMKELSTVVLKWFGIDGLFNMQTCMALVIFLSIFFTDVISAIIALIVAIVKMFHNKINDYDNECHDFICSIIGIVVGMFLSSYAGLALLFR